MATKVSPPRAPATKVAPPRRPAAPKGLRLPGFLKLPGGGNRDPNLPKHWQDYLPLVAQLVVIVIVLVVAGFLSNVWWSWHHHVKAGDHTLDHQALWLDPTWSGSYHDKATDVQSLATELDTYRFSDVYVSVGTLSAAGRLPPAASAYAPGLIAGLRQLAPTVRVDAALVGRPKELAAGGTLDLHSPAVRASVVATANELLTKDGFGGLHLDLSSVVSGDKDFLALVSSLHQVTAAHHATLSVEGGGPEPLGGAARVGRWMRVAKIGYRPWTFGFYHQVADRADEIVVRASGTGLPTPWTYGSLVGWDTHELLSAIGGHDPLIIDIPTRKGASSITRHGWAENVGSGIRGIRHGLDMTQASQRSRVGLAINNQANASAGDFATLGRQWVCTAAAPPACQDGTPPQVVALIPGSPTP